MIREIVKNKILESGMKQKDISVVLGVASTNFSSFLNGTRSLPYKKFIKLMDYLGLTFGNGEIGVSYLPAEEAPEIFKQSLRSHGMKVVELSNATSIDSATLSSFFNFSRAVPIRHIESMMDVLGVSVVKYVGNEN